MFCQPLVNYFENTDIVHVPFPVGAVLLGSSGKHRIESDFGKLPCASRHPADAVQMLLLVKMDAVCEEWTQC